MSHKPGDWWDQSWSPIEGCTPISPGCENCWAQSFLRRFRGDTGVHLFPERLDQPLRWRKPRTVFVAPLGDLFHENVPDWFSSQVFARMLGVHHHTYILLTKRADRMRRFVSFHAKAGLIKVNGLSLNPCPPHIYLGVSIEDQECADERIPILRRIPAAVHWLSLEPLLGPIRADLTDIEWLVVGGETGPGARPMHPQWVRQIRDQCIEAGVPFWLKSLGPGKGRLLDGREWNQKPKGGETR
jgi:protein gp37